jgi:hypothetical protein
MATSILKILPQGGGEMVTSILLILLLRGWGDDHIQSSYPLSMGEVMATAFPNSRKNEHMIG